MGRMRFSKNSALMSCAAAPTTPSKSKPGFRAAMVCTRAPLALGEARRPIQLETELQTEDHFTAIPGGCHFAEGCVGLAAESFELRGRADGLELSMIERVERFGAEFQPALLAFQRKLLELREIVVVEARL